MEESRQFRLKRLRTQIRLFLPLLFLLFSLVFIGVGASHNPYVVEFRTCVFQVVTPISYVISFPLRVGENAISHMVSFFKTYQENKVLKEEVKVLKEWKYLALKMKVNQEEYQRLLNYVPPKKAKSITAHVLADNGENFSQSLIVSAGSNAGVSKGNIAMTTNGVLGRIVEVGPYFSRLMMLTDYMSRVPVIVGKKRILCILSGDNSDQVKLVSVPENVSIKKGDVVLSSGHVGVYPSGLPLGVVSSVQDSEIFVSLFETNKTPEFVRLVDFGLSDVLLKNECLEGK